MDEYSQNQAMYVVRFKKKKAPKKQHLINSRFGLLKTRQQFCGDISTPFQSHCVFFLECVFLVVCLLVMVFVCSTSRGMCSIGKCELSTLL